MSFTVPPTAPARPNRCQLFGPGSRPELFAKMAASDADVINLDLEDSVPPADKPAARANIVKALFDTNILIDYLGGIAQARDELARYRESAISVISWMEVMVGARPEVELATRRFLSQFSIVAVDRPVAERAVLIRRGRRIRLPDAIIQASSEVHAMLLVTRNTRDFDAASPSVRVPYAL